MPTQMRARYWVPGMLLAGLLLLTAAFAEVTVPTLQHRVTDLTTTLSGEQRSSLESRLAAFEQQKGSQIAVLIVPTTQPEDIAQYSIRVVEQWQLGRKSVDDGVLVLIAKNDRTTRIEVGYGLEGVIPDAIAKRIIEDIMIPYFRQGDYAGGISAGVDKLISLINGEPLPVVEPPSMGKLSNYFLPLVFLAMLCGIILRAVLGKFMGGVINGSLVASLIWFLGGGLMFALFFGFIAFMLTQSDGRSSGGFGGGYDGGGFSSGGGFSGGGGGFGGGGASGSW